MRGDVGEVADPVGDQVLELGPVGRLLRLDDVRPVERPVDAAPGPERLEKVGQPLRGPYREADDAGAVPHARWIEQDLVMAGRQGVAPLVGRRARIIDIEDAGDRLLLEPFAGVARRDPGAFGEGRCRGRPAIGERPVQPEALPEVDRLELERGRDGGEELGGEGLPAVAGVEGRCGGHRRTPGADVDRPIVPSAPPVGDGRQPAATASRSASGSGRWASTGVTWWSTISREPLTPSR